MWIRRRCIDFCSHLVIGCGQHNRHRKLHCYAATMDTDPAMDPDILGDLLEPVENLSLRGRFGFVVCEYLPSFLYTEFLVWKHLAYVRAVDSAIVVISPDPLHVAAMRRHAARRGWQTARLSRADELPRRWSGDGAIALHLQRLLPKGPGASYVIT